VTIHIRNETLLGLKAAARMLPPGQRGRPVTLSCVFLWIVDGVSLPDGSVCRLSGVRIGGRWLTSVEALRRFAEAQTPCLNPEPAATPRTAARRNRAAEKAAKPLEKMGI
jgi:hypothetical protein